MFIIFIMFLGDEEVLWSVCKRVCDLCSHAWGPQKWLKGDIFNHLEEKAKKTLSHIFKALSSLNLVALVSYKI